MAATFGPSYGADTGLTITSLNSLGNNAYAGSAVVDNSALSPPAEDVLVGVAIVSAAAGVSTTGTVAVFAYSDVDALPHYTAGVTGTDAVQTPVNGSALRPLGIMDVNAVNTTYYGGRWSVAKAFGGTMPKKWGIVVQNLSGAALAAAGNAVRYETVNGQSTP
jgi:hypothetical protein